MKQPVIYIICIAICCMLNFSGKAQTDTTQQNLVYNPSFEDYLDCPQRIESLGILTSVIGWWQATNGSADYFNKCGRRECNIPQNKLGIQEAHTGIGYCGIYVSKNDYREYLETQLKEPLQAGKRYRVTYYVSLSEYSTGCIATMGALFTNQRVYSTSSELLVYKEEEHLGNNIKQVILQNYEPQIQNPYENLLENTLQWEKVSGEFVAKGGENYLTIGNFRPMEQSNYQEIEKLTYVLPGSYYYIEDVEVVCLDCNNTVATNITTEPKPKGTEPKPDYYIGQTIVLENIFFQFDKSNLLPESYLELEKLIGILKQYPTMKIEIAGHTDDKGSEAYNIKLSEERAQSVVNYLIKRGVMPIKLKFKGYGKGNPIATNKTEEGRAKNRRVEFKILDI